MISPTILAVAIGAVVLFAFVAFIIVAIFATAIYRKRRGRGSSVDQVIVGRPQRPRRSRTPGLPQMYAWQSDLVRDKVNQHLREKAEAETWRLVAEANGYELQNDE